MPDAFDVVYEPMLKTRTYRTRSGSEKALEPWLFGGWLKTGSPIAPLITEFIWPVHTRYAPWYSKLAILSYLGTHLAMAIALPMSFLAILWFRHEPVRQYLQSPLDVQLYLFIVFNLVGALCSQYVKRKHLARKLAVGGQLHMGKLSWEMIEYTLMKFLFFSSLHI